MYFQISPSPRLRTSPYFDATVAEGVVSFTPYNHMLLPISYGNPMAEYRRLTEAVAMWDVAAERQIEVSGRDAARLVQVLVPRRVERMRPGTGWYVPVCDHRGVLINDPVLLRHAEDRFWFSIADSDLLLWARAIAAERSMDVRIFEADASPLAVQGPRAEDTVAALLGEQIRGIRRFCFQSMRLDDIPLVVARSGWSRQGGFELYLTDARRGDALWQRVREAGAPFGIGPGGPNQMERVESGLLSWGGDTDDETDPFEVRLGRYVDLDAPDEVIGITALRAIHARGPRRHQLGVFIDSNAPVTPTDRRGEIYLDDRRCGTLSAQAWSPRLRRNIGLCLVCVQARPGDTVRVELPGGDTVPGQLTELPFL